MTLKYVAVLAAVLTAGAAQAADVGALEIARQGYLFAGGKYVDGAGGKYMAGQAYVEYQIPPSAPIPIPSS